MLQGQQGSSQVESSLNHVLVCCRGSRAAAKWKLPSINITRAGSPDQVSPDITALRNGDGPPAGFQVSFQLPEAGQWELHGSWQNHTLDLPASITAVQQLLQPAQWLVNSPALHNGQLQGELLVQMLLQNTHAWLALPRRAAAACFETEPCGGLCSQKQAPSPGLVWHRLAWSACA